MNQEKLKNKLNKSSFRALILCYHQISYRKNDPFGLAVSKENFFTQMKYLKSRYDNNIISMDKLIYYLKNNEKKNKRYITITFDDGYSDNYFHAKPILEKFKIPATFFISTANINKTDPFWWDFLTMLFYRHLILAGTVKIKAKKQDCLRKINPTVKEKFFKFYSFVHLLPAGIISKTFNQIKLSLQNLNLPEIRYRTMNEAEIRELAKNPLFCIGAHTHNHVFLSKQPLEMQKNEIKKSKDVLEKIIQLPVKYFAFPYGGKGTYTRQTINFLIEDGFKAACSIAEMAVNSSASLYELPRIPIHNWNVVKFKNVIEKF